jgi:hypothetical protein
MDQHGTVGKKQRLAELFSRTVGRLTPRALAESGPREGQNESECEQTEKAGRDLTDASNMLSFHLESSDR